MQPWLDVAFGLSDSEAPTLLCENSLRSCAHAKLYFIRVNPSFIRDYPNLCPQADKLPPLRSNLLGTMGARGYKIRRYQ